MSVLDQIMGVKEAGELWELSADHVKRLCRDGDVKAKRIGKTWVLDKNQPNPKGGRRMRKEVFTVVVKEEYEAVAGPMKEEVKSKEVDSEKQAIELANQWAEEHSNDYVYIYFDRAADGQQGYLNRNGYGVTGSSWTD